jgi:hypothetical protein
MKNTFKGGYKQYLRATPHQILNYLKEEARLVSPKELGDFDSLTHFDLRDEASFLLQLDSRVVGFVTIKFLPGDQRRLMKIYVTPNARKHGCASFAIRGLKINKITIPVRLVSLLGLCRKIGFTYCARQNYPTQVAELESFPNVQRHPVQVAQLG